MKFDYYINDKQQSCFEAIIENEEEKRGFRGQAPYSPIELVNNILIVNYVSKKDLDVFLDRVRSYTIDCIYLYL